MHDEDTQRAQEIGEEVLRIVSRSKRPRGSTYRFQFNSEFTFQDATKLVPYLQALGITHVYASPYLAAQKGSPHGYDVVQHDRLNPEVGSDDDYRAFVDALRAGDGGRGTRDRAGGG
jgi:(1->4)-alpha-D-glucan 1-alpha-D-glucosylmutase